jgi:hypothetical protein
VKRLRRAFGKPKQRRTRFDESELAAAKQSPRQKIRRDAGATNSKATSTTPARKAGGRYKFNDNGKGCVQSAA